MDPQLKSWITSVALGGSMSVAVLAAKYGIIPASDESGLANMLVTIAFGLGALGLGWYKSRQHTQDAMIKSVNAADNGVTVVKTSDAVRASIPTINVAAK